MASDKYNPNEASDKDKQKAQRGLITLLSITAVILLFGFGVKLGSFIAS